MLFEMKAEILKYYAEKSEPVTIHFGGKTRKGVLRYFERKSIEGEGHGAFFYVETPEGDIELGHGEKIRIGEKEYVTKLKRG